MLAYSNICGKIAGPEFEATKIRPPCAQIVSPEPAAIRKHTNPAFGRGCGSRGDAINGSRRPLLGTSGSVFRYRLHWTDGSDAGEAEYAVGIRPGELIWLRDGRRVTVVDLVPLGQARYDGLLMVEAA